MRTSALLLLLLLRFPNIRLFNVSGACLLFGIHPHRCQSSNFQPVDLSGVPVLDGVRDSVLDGVLDGAFWREVGEDVGEEACCSARLLIFAVATDSAAVETVCVEGLPAG